MTSLVRRYVVAWLLPLAICNADSCGALRWTPAIWRFKWWVRAKFFPQSWKSKRRDYIKTKGLDWQPCLKVPVYFFIKCKFQTLKFKFYGEICVKLADYGIRPPSPHESWDQYWRDAPNRGTDHQLVGRRWCFVNNVVQTSWWAVALKVLWHQNG